MARVSFNLVKAFAALFIMFAAFNMVTATPHITPHSQRTTLVSRTEPSDQCEPGKTQCCALIAMKGDAFLATFLNRLGQSVDSLLSAVEATKLVGVACIPVNALGITQNACANKPVCCSGFKLKGLVSVGCVPISVTV